MNEILTLAVAIGLGITLSDAISFVINTVVQGRLAKRRRADLEKWANELANAFDYDEEEAPPVRPSAAKKTVKKTTK